MPPPIGCERSYKEPVEDDGVKTLAGGHVVSCLSLLDMKDPPKSLWKTMVSHHWLEDMLCHRLNRLDVKSPTKNLHHWLEDMLCHASSYWM